MVFFEIVKWEFLEEAFDWRFIGECGSSERDFYAFISMHTNESKDTEKI